MREIIKFLLISRKLEHKMPPDSDILSKGEVGGLSDRRMPYVHKKLSDDELRPSEALEKLKEEKPDRQMKAASDPLQLQKWKPPVDPSAYPFILEGQLASPGKIQMIGRLPKVPKIEQTVTIPDDGQESRTVQFCRVPKAGFLKILNWAEFDTVLILFDGKERYGRIMVKGSDNKEEL